MPTIVATSIPLNTVVPMIRRSHARRRWRSIIGMIPIINDTAVIITARKRRGASRAASTIDSPPRAPAAGRTQRSESHSSPPGDSSTSPI